MIFDKGEEICILLIIFDDEIFGRGLRYAKFVDISNILLTRLMYH